MTILFRSACIGTDALPDCHQTGGMKSIDCSSDSGFAGIAGFDIAAAAAAAAAAAFAAAAASWGYTPGLAWASLAPASCQAGPGTPPRTARPSRPARPSFRVAASWDCSPGLAYGSA